MSAAEQREAFAALVRQHQQVRSAQWRELLELRESIAEARKKGASYETIRIYLGKTAVVVSADTVERFCHEVLGEPKLRRSRGRNGVLVSRRLVKQRAGPSAPLRYRPSSGPRVVDPKSL